MFPAYHFVITVMTSHDVLPRMMNKDLTSKLYKGTVLYDTAITPLIKYT